MNLLDQSGVTGGGLDPFYVHALFVNMDNMWTERFGNYDCLVCIICSHVSFESILNGQHQAEFTVMSQKQMIRTQIVM